MEILRKINYGCEDSDARVKPEHDGVGFPVIIMRTAAQLAKRLRRVDHPE
jgi:hypothetical protein